MRGAGFVLAGGRSSRMGQNKARLKVGSRYLVEVVAHTVAAVTGSVTLIGDPSSFADLTLECLPDLRPGLGPLGGLEAALASNRGELNLVLGCDMPDIQPTDLKRLLDVAAETSALCTVAVDSAGHRHPRCAVYHRNALPLVRAALDTRRLRLLHLVEELKAVEVHIHSLLSNLNTPEQWTAWKKAAAQQPV